MRITKGRIILLFLTCAFLVILVFQNYIKALLLITEEFPQIPVKPLGLLSAAPEHQEVRLEENFGMVVGDLYVPKSLTDRKQYPAIILAMGVKTSEKDKPIIRHFGQTLARLGYIVFWPRWEILDQGRSSFEQPETFTASFEYLSNQDYVKPDQISYLGFSVGSSVALVSAADPKIANKVRSVVFFGGYFDVGEYLEALTSGRNGWQPAEGAVTHIQEILEEKGLTGTAELKQEDLDTINPAKHIKNLHAKVFILHDRGDTYVPYQESEKLYKALPRPQVGEFTIVSLFEHVQPKTGFSKELIGEFLKAYLFISKALAFL